MKRWLACTACAALVAACGARSPLDDVDAGAGGSAGSTARAASASSSSSAAATSSGAGGAPAPACPALALPGAFATVAAPGFDLTQPALLDVGGGEVVVVADELVGGAHEMAFARVPAWPVLSATTFTPRAIEDDHGNLVTTGAFAGAVGAGAPQGSFDVAYVAPSGELHVTSIDATGMVVLDASTPSSGGGVAALAAQGDAGLRVVLQTSSTSNSLFVVGALEDQDVWSAGICGCSTTGATGDATGTAGGVFVATTANAVVEWLDPAAECVSAPAEMVATAFVTPDGAAAFTYLQAGVDVERVRVASSPGGGAWLGYTAPTQSAPVLVPFLADGFGLKGVPLPPAGADPSSFAIAVADDTHVIAALLEDVGVAPAVVVYDVSEAATTGPVRISHGAPIGPLAMVSRPGQGAVLAWTALSADGVHHEIVVTAVACSAAEMR